MLKNYIKTAFRSFKRHKSFSLINVIGLSIGMACSILILLWVFDELEHDRFHKDSDQIVQVMTILNSSEGKETSKATSALLAPALKEAIPDFQYIASYTWNEERLFTKDNVSLKESGLYARPDFFYILDIKLLHGDKSSLISSPESIVISKKVAQKYFGRINVVGESITIDGDQLHTVTGVYEELPDNSSFQFNFVLPFESWSELTLSWGNNAPRTIAKIHPHTDINNLNSKIQNFIKKHDEISSTELLAYPFADLYLYGQFENGEMVGGRIEYVWLFSVVAVFILLIACINFINLSTAKATKRAKEVGIRKAIGAGKSSLIGQFLSESMIITFFSMVVSVLLVEMSLPLFNNLTGKTIEINYLEPTLLLTFLGTVLFTGLVAGSYPAFYLSSFEAVKTLKGSIMSSSGEVFARKGLIVFQFTMSVILIISTMVVYQQIQYSQTKNLGYQKENLIRFPIEGNLIGNWRVFKNQLHNLPNVKNVSRTVNTFLSSNSTTSGLHWPGKNPDEEVRFEFISADYGMVETMGFKVIAGRTHSEEFSNEGSRILINIQAAEVMGMQDPIGKFVTLWGDEVEIIGVVKNFHFQSIHEKISPTFIRLLNFGTLAYIRINSENIQFTIASIEDVYRKINPDYPFNYEFMDQEYAALYQSEQQMGKLAKYFTLFAIIITCLGLFGLTAFTTERRTKEIGVRKVLGASVQSLVLLLSKDFTRLVLIAICIAIPISWFLMNRWLSGFAYSSGLKWWIFARAGLLALVIAWFTVGWQSIRTALLNPVESLRSN